MPLAGSASQDAPRHTAAPAPASQGAPPRPAAAAQASPSGSAGIQVRAHCWFRGGCSQAGRGSVAVSRDARCCLVPCRCTHAVSRLLPLPDWLANVAEAGVRIWRAGGGGGGGGRDWLPGAADSTPRTGPTVSGCVRYTTITSGTCKSHGYEVVSQDDCAHKAAAGIARPWGASVAVWAHPPSSTVDRTQVLPAGRREQN
jgi:hypothetical protein